MEIVTRCGNLRVFAAFAGPVLKGGPGHRLGDELAASRAGAVRALAVHPKGAKAEAESTLTRSASAWTRAIGFSCFLQPCRCFVRTRAYPSASVAVGSRKSVRFLRLGGA